jgi:hypothetical protein
VNKRRDTPFLSAQLLNRPLLRDRHEAGRPLAARLASRHSADPPYVSGPPKVI